MPANPLTDTIPAVWRKRIYALAFVASIVGTCLQAADGDWREAWLPVLTALTSALSAANVNEYE